MRRWLSWQLQKWLPDPGVSFHRLEMEQALFDDIQWASGERVLDVGCYRGEYAARLARRGAFVVACDINANALKDLSRGPVLTTAASAYDLPFASGTFDTVLAQNLVVLLESPAQALQEFARCCAPGGRIITTLNNTHSPFSIANRWAERLWPNCPWATIRLSRNAWSVSRWIDEAQRNGLRLERVHSCNLCWPLVHRLRGVWLDP